MSEPLGGDNPAKPSVDSHQSNAVKTDVSETGALPKSLVVLPSTEAQGADLDSEREHEHEHELEVNSPGPSEDESEAGDETFQLAPEHHHPQDLDLDQDDVHANARYTDDGRLDITIEADTQSLDRLMGPALEESEEQSLESPLQSRSHLSDLPAPPPPLNIVIQVVGSRGDVQPFIALGQALLTYGHRVRLATHPTFKKFVEEIGLEFFSIGGDPAQLMVFMVKNPGLVPGFEAIRQGDVGKRRKDMAEIIDGCWRSCIEAGDGMSTTTSSDQDQQKLLQTGARPFIADAIIANPPSFAHIHCAERLRIPLHLMFTMPWSPTRAFGHPLANIQSSGANPSLKNYMSYAMVETMVWQGVGDLVNRFRVKTLGLGEIDSTAAPGMVSRLKIPHTYAWSPTLIPKPQDWRSHISIAGFFFLPLASAYTPPADLAEFLAQGPPPVYIGFGSIVVDDPEALTTLILEAVSKTGVRALISKGWGGIGGQETRLPSNVYMLGNCPHDWLFKRVSCVVHHGGAGTTAAGIACGKPTVIVPFFGDQPFWGGIVAQAGAGPAPIPYKKLTSDRLASAINEALQPSVTEKAISLGASINQERGAESAVANFHAQLPLERMRCAVMPERIAVWRVAKTKICLSAMAAAVLIRERMLDIDGLRPYGPCIYYMDRRGGLPLSRGVTAASGLISELVLGFGDVSVGIYRSVEKGTKPVSTTTDLEVITSRSEGQSPTSPDAVKSPLSQPPSYEAKSTAPPLVGKKPSATRRGIKRISTAFLKSPIDATVAIADGLNNAPALYGDDTVRPPEEIKGIKSGLVAGGKALGLGVYDGFSGVVTQAVRGQKEEGSVGLYKGIGKGIGGLVLKPLAGVSGLFGYSFQGIYEEIKKKYGVRVQGHLRAARIAQGYDECVNMTREECAEIIGRWQLLDKEQMKNN